MEEQVYTLGPKGFELVASELQTSVSALPYSRKNSRTATLFLKHTIMTNNVRIVFDHAVKEHPYVAIKRTIPEYEIQNPTKKNSHEKFVLRDRLVEGEGSARTTHSFRPDCLFLAHEKLLGPDRCAALFLEADRGTESVANRIRQKFRVYSLFFRRGLHYKKYGARAMRCLFVLEYGGPHSSDQESPVLR